MKKQSSLYILAIGASAGGLDALRDFFSHLHGEFPNMVIIVAQHLIPTHESLLSHFLSKETTHEVIQAVDNILLEPNKIYITPFDKDISIINRRIVLTKPHSEIAPKPSIDILFNSVSIEAKDKAIGIILSGTGNDGSVGIRSIKSMGGLVIVQQPETAKFGALPQAAIDTKAFDKILSPDKMGEALISHITMPEETHRQNLKPEINNESMEKLLILLSERFGTNFSGYKPSTIHRRLEKRLLSLSISSVDEYLLYIEKNQAELDELFNFILINVTNFFRDSEAFEELEKTLDKIIAGKDKKESIRIWITACSTGEEAYSIAILLTELLQKANNDLVIQIFATDIDERVVAFARKGRYSAFDVEEVPENLLSKYFISYGTEYEITKSIRNLILFTRHDISSNPPFLKMDMISCRNLLIYFGQDLQKQILPIFHYSLNVNGYLFLGKSETIGQFKDLFSIVDEKNKIYQRKVGSSLKTIKFSAFTTKFRAIPTVEKAENQKLSLTEMVKDTLFNTYEYPYVVISDNYEIHSIYGDVRLYLTLQEGDMNSNILKMVNKELQIELRSIIAKCIRDRIQVKSEIKKFELFGNTHHVRMTVRPIISQQANNELYIVIFERLEPDEFFMQSNPVSETEKSVLYNQELERELFATKEQLNSFIEELETTNEELQSMNEELQSTNEELQSSVEELGTSNEELQSSNEEIQIAYLDLKKANEELERKDKLLIESEREMLANQEKYLAIMNNSIQGFVIADESGKVIEANKAYCDVFGYSETEIKSLSRTQLVDLHDPRLQGILSERSSTGVVVKAEVTGIKMDGEKFDMEFSSFSFIDKDGKKLIGSFVNDISVRKKTEAQVSKLHVDLAKSEKRFRALIENGNDIIALIDSNNKPIYRSPSATRISGYTDADRALESESWHPDDVEKQIQVMAEVIKNPGVSFKLSFRQKHKNGQYIWLDGTLTNMLHDEAINAIVANVKDVTESKKFEEHQALFASIVNSSDDAIISKNLDGTITSWNRGAEKLFGYSIDEVMGKNILMLIPPERYNEEPEIIRRLKKGELIEHYETERVRKNGSIVNISITISPIKDKKENIVGASKIARDITQKKKTENEILKLNHDLSKSENRFRTIIENSGDVIVLSDRNLKPLYRSPSLRRIIGVNDLERADNSELDNMIHPEDMSILTEIHSEILKTPGIPHKVSFRGIHKTGSYIWFQGVLTNMLENDAINAIVSNLSDVTEIKKNETELKASFDLVNAQNQRLLNFSYIISHNLRSHTSNIKSILSLILDSSSEDEKTDMLRHLKVVSNALDDTLYNLNEIVSIHANLHVHVEPLHLCEYINKTAVILEDKIVRNEVLIHNNVPEELVVQYNPAYLESILLNFISNAIRYRHPERKPVINLNHALEDGKLVLMISDNGIGIDLKKNGAKLFGMYKTFTKNPESKGIGLFITKNQIEAMGGKVIVESEPGVGTTFKIFIK